MDIWEALPLKRGRASGGFGAEREGWDRWGARWDSGDGSVCPRSFLI